jgi:hypothetical protein
MNKVVATADEAVAVISRRRHHHDGRFGLCGIPNT